MNLNLNFFLLENVGSMSKENTNIISAALGVQPIRINSNLFSAQDRDRYYWTNIPQNMILQTKNIVLKDIVEPAENIPEKYWYNQTFIYNGDNAKVQATLNLNGHDILKRVHNLNNKCGTLTCCRGGNLQKKVYQNNKCRKLIPLEYERLQTLPDNYTKGVSDSQRYNCLGNCWTVKVIEHLFRGLTSK